MAVTGLLVFKRPDFQRYLLTQDGAAGTTINLPAADIIALAPPANGKLLSIARANTQGYGAFAPGPLNQAQARALLLSDRSGANPGATWPTARAEITPRTGLVNPAWNIDADVDGGGVPRLNITAPAGASTAYLDIEIEGGTIGA